MKNSGMSETMQRLMRKSICAVLSLMLLLSAVLPVKAAAETAPAKVVRVGSFEDTFNYVNEKGARKGYGYELLATLSGYTGWQFEYVTCDWSDCFEKLKNGEIDIMGDISYTEDRAEEMLFSDEPMGVEKYYLYADLSRADISASDFKTLNGKKIGVLMGTEPEVMLTEGEEKYGLKTEHVNVSNNEDAKQKLANHEIDCFVSLEESFWAERGISTITRVGESGIYYAINKNRPDIKEELDDAMRTLDEAVPFYMADLYKRYFSMDYTPILIGEEKAWLKEHGAIKMGFLASDSGVSTYDPATGELTGQSRTIFSFEPFEREHTSTVSKVEGSGIGMGIVKKLVGLMSGTVEVESKIGVGSTFTVTIPSRIASQEETQAKRETAPSGEKSQCGVKILLTEDNDLNAEIATELLREEGCTVDRAKDGVECVDLLEKASNGTYRLILMDIQMPVMNGYDAAKKIRRMDDPQKAGIPIIAMTANAFSEDRQAALDAGMNDHVSKPINMNILVPTIWKYL